VSLSSCNEYLNQATERTPPILLQTNYLNNILWQTSDCEQLAQNCSTAVLKLKGKPTNFWSQVRWTIIIALLCYSNSIQQTEKISQQCSSILRVL